MPCLTTGLAASLLAKWEISSSLPAYMLESAVGYAVFLAVMPLVFDIIDRSSENVAQGVVSSQRSQEATHLVASHTLEDEKNE